MGPRSQRVHIQLGCARSVPGAREVLWSPCWVRKLYLQGPNFLKAEVRHGNSPGWTSPPPGGQREGACVCRGHAVLCATECPWAVRPRPSAPPAEPGQGEPRGGGARGTWAWLTHLPGLMWPRVLIEEASVTDARLGSRPDVRTTGGEFGAVLRTGRAPTPSLCWNPAAHGGRVRSLWGGKVTRAEPTCRDVCRVCPLCGGSAGRLRKPSQQRRDAPGTRGSILCSDPGSEPGTQCEHGRGEGGHVAPLSPGGSCLAQ